MKMMQTRFGVDDIKTMIKALDEAPPERLTPHENIAAAELAARLRHRAIKLWGAGYAAAVEVDGDGDTPLPFATVPLDQLP